MVFDGSGDATAKQAAAALPADAGHAWSVAPEYAADSVRAIPAAEAPSPEPAAPASPTAASAQGGHEIVFVSNDVADWQQLVAGFGPDARVVVLDSSHDGVEQIAAALAGERDVTAIHIVSHGTQGELSLGKGRLNAASMQGRYLGELTAIGQALTAEGDILIYGCDFSTGEAGLKAAMLLGGITGADIAASTDLTGATRFGADWQLETSVGAIETASLDAPDWDHVLIPPVIGLDGTNLVTNPSFDTNTNGWTSSQGGVERNTFATFGLPSSGFGTHAIEVEGPVGSPTTTPLYVETTVATVIGQTYTYSILAATRSSNTSDRGIISAAGSSLSFTTNGTWQTYALTFTATSTTTTLRIASDGSTSGFGPLPGDGTGLIVDNVRVRATNRTVTYTENGAAVAVAGTGNLVADIDSTNLSSATIILTNRQAGDQLTVGTLPTGITSAIDTSVAGEITVTLSGSSSKANYETALRAVLYSTTSDTPATTPRTVNVTVNDGTTNSNTAVTTINIAEGNDAPVNTVPVSGGMADAGVPKALTGLSISDDASIGNMTVTLSVAGNGTLAATSGGGVTVGGTPTALTLTGTRDAINAFLAGTPPTFTSTAGSGSTTITMLTNDNGNTGSGGPLTDSDSFIITLAGAPPIVDLNSTPVPTNIIVNGGFADGTGWTPGGALNGGGNPIIGNGQTVFAVDNGTQSISQTVSGLSSGPGSAGAAQVTFDLGWSNHPLNSTPSTFDMRIAGVTYARLTTSVGSSSNAGTVQYLNGATGNVTSVTGTTFNNWTRVPITVNLPSNVADSGALQFVLSSTDPNADDVSVDNVVVLAYPAETGVNAGRDWAATFSEGQANGTRIADGPTNGDANDSSVIDATSPNMVSGQIVLTNKQAGDVLSLNGTVLADGSAGTFNGIAYTVVDNGTSVTLNLSGSATMANYNGFIQAVTFASSSDNPNTSVVRDITVKVNDGVADSNVAHAFITVIAVNDAPVLSFPASYTMAEDSALRLSDISVTDPDAGSGNISVTLSVAASQGALSGTSAAGVTATAGTNGSNATLTLTGTLANINAYLANAASQPTFTPTANFNTGSSSLNLGIATNDNGNTGSGGALGASGFATIRITPVNDAPAGSNRTVSIAEDTSYAFTAADFVLADPLDSPANTLQAVIITTLPPAGEGILRLNGVAVTAGQSIALADLPQLRFTPSANFDGSAQGAFTFQVVDNGGLINGGQDTDQSPNTFAFNITEVNDAPVLSAPSGTQNTTEDTALVFSTATGNAITISDVDDAGEIYQLRFGVPTGAGTLTLGSTTGLSSVSGNGTNELIATGTRTSLNAALDGLRYTPAPDFHGSAGAANLSFTVAEMTSLGFVNAGFEQPDIPNNTFRTLDQSLVPGWDTSATDGMIEIWDAPFNGVGAFEGDQFAELNAFQASTLSQTFVPSAAGSPIQLAFAHRGRLGVDTMRVVATDLGADGAFGTADDTVLFDQQVSDGQAWRQFSVDLGIGTGNAIRIAFTAVSTANGNAAAGNFLDGVSIFDASLSSTRTLSLNVTPVADIVDDVITTPEDTARTFNVITGASEVSGADNFENPGRALTAINGAAFTPGAAIAITGGTISAQSDGSVAFTPTADFNGTTSFTYTVTTANNTETATATITVAPVNDPPVNTVPTTVQVTDEDSPLAIPGITVADPDVGQLTTTLTVPADVGSLQVTNLGSGVGVTGNGTETLVLQGTAAQINDALASLSFIPRADFNHGAAGTSAITIGTSKGIATTTSSVNVRVAPVADIVNDIVATNEDTPLTFNPITGAGETSGADGFESGARVISQINGVALIPGAPITITGGMIVVAADGTVNFTPNAGYNGTTSFTYAVRSGGAGVADETATVTLTVNSVNDAPSGTDRTVTILENGSYGFSGGDFGLTDLNDTPANTLASVIITTLAPASEGILRLGGVAVTAGQTIPVGSIGSLTFTPLPSVNGDGVGAFTFQVVDNGGAANGGQNTDQSPNVFRFNIEAVNDVPVANNDTFSTNEDTPTDIDVRANDTDIDTGDTLTVTAIDGTPIFPGGGGVAVTGGTVTLLPSGVLRFTPSLDYNGTGTFTYTVRDSAGATANATVTGTVLPTPDSITNIVPGAQAGTEDSAIVFASTNGNAIRVADPDGDVLTTTISVPRGTLTLATTAGLTFATGDGTGDAIMTFSGSAAAINAALEGLRYIPTPDFNGATQLAITTSKPAQPGVVTTDTDTVAINLAPAVDIVADTITAREDTPVTFNVLTGLGGASSDTFEDAGRVVTSVTQPPAGQGGVAFAADGTITYTPPANFNGATSFSYTVTSGGVTETATVTVNVAGENDRPTVDLDGSGTGTGYATTYRENGAGVAIADVDASVADLDGTSLVGATVVITNGAPGDVLSIAGTLPAGITANFDAGSFTLTLSGSASPADYTAAIEAIRFSSTSEDPSAGQRTIAVTVSDGELISVPAIATVSVVPLNDAPSGQNAVLAVGEDTTYSFRPADFGFTDPAEGDAFTGIVLTTVPGNGTMLIGGAPVAAGTFVTAAQLTSGQLTWRPAANANGAGLGFFTFQVRDDGGTADGGQDTDQSPNTISFTVSPVNDPPVAADLAVTIPEDGSASGRLPVATDPDADPLTYSAGTTQPSNGTVTVNPDGTYLYTPAPDFNGQDTFSYVVNDGQGGRNEYTVTVTITPVNDRPTVATPIADRTRPDGASVTIDVSTAFTDEADGDPLTYSQTGLPPGLTMDSAGRITGTILRDASIGGPNGDGVYTVTITAVDGSGGTVTDTFVFRVTNPEPTAIDDAATTPEDTPITINVLDGSASGGVPDRDPDGDPLQLVSASAANGTVTFGADGTVIYTPNANFNGTDTILYTVTDGNRGTQQAAVTVTVLPRNDVPTVSTIPDRVRNDGETVTIDTRSFFTDIDGDTLSFSATNLPPGLSIDSAGRITGQIAPGASGPTGASNYTVTITADDGNGGTVQTSFTIRVLNLPPVAVDDAATTAEDTAVLINVAVNDSDPDGDPRQIVRVEGAALTVGGPAVSTADGQVQLVDVGGVQQLRFTPNANFNGTTTFSYDISDGNGGTDRATVTVTVAPVNDAPVSSGGVIPPLVRADGQSFDYDLSPFFSDPDAGDILTYSAADLPLGLSIDPATGRITGTIDRGASQGGPANNGVYTVTVTANDRAGAGGLSTTRTFELRATNPGPRAVNDAVTVTEDAVDVPVDVLANDTDPDGDTLTIVGGSVSAGHGTVTIDNGVILYTPNPDYNGVDTIIYTIADGNGGFSTASVTVTVTAVNDAPVGSQIPELIDSDGQVIPGFGVSDYFDDPEGQDLAFTATGLPPGLQIDPDTGIISGQIDGNASRLLPYVVTVTAVDPDGGSTQQVFNWYVQNPAPQAFDDALTVGQNQTGSGNVITGAVGGAGQDFDVDGDPLEVVAVNGTLTNVGVAVAGTNGGTFVITGDGTYTFDPGQDFDSLGAGETATTTIVYRIADGGLGANEANDTAVLTVTVMGGNDAPLAVTIPGEAGQDSQLILPVDISDFFTDADGDALIFSATGLPPGLTISPTGQMSGTLAAGASVGGATVGSRTYTVIVSADDGQAVTQQSFTYTVTNPAPVAVNDTVTTGEDAPVTFNVLDGTAGGTVPDRDPDGDPIQVDSAVAANGSVTVGANGAITYTPNANFNGTDTIAYRISDGQGGFSSAAVLVTVTAGNDLPVATPIPDTSRNDGDSVSLDVSGSFSDLDGDTLTYSAVGLPPGLAIDPATGIISGQIAPGASGPTGSTPYSVTVQVSDGNGGLESDTFVFTVDNIAPIAEPNTATTIEDTPVDMPVLTGDSDPDGDALAVARVNGTPVTLGGPPVAIANGTVQLVDAGGTPVLRFTPAPDFNGTASFTYAISDGNGGEDTAEASVTVQPVNDAPTAQVIPAQTRFDGAGVTFPAGAFFADRDAGDDLTFAVAGLPPGLSMDAATGMISGVVTGDASQGGPNGDGLYRVTITATDPSGLTVTSTFSFSITNPPPEAKDDTVVVAEDGTVTFNPITGVGTTSGSSGADRDPDGDALTITRVGGQPISVGTPLVLPQGTVTLQPDGFLTFAPRADLSGPVTLVYEISDENGGTTTADIRITVTPVNDPPVVDLDATAPGTGHTVSFIEGDPPVAIADGSGFALDAENQITSLDISLSGFQASQDVLGLGSRVQLSPGNPSVGTVVFGATTFAYTYDGASTLHIENAAGSGVPMPANAATSLLRALQYGNTSQDPSAAPRTVSITVTDVGGATSPAAIATIGVVPVNDGPASTPLSGQSGNDGDPVNLDLSGSFSDPEAGDALIFTATGLPPGLMIDPATGIVSGTIGSSASQTGPYTVVVRATDGSGASSEQSFVWTIANPAPIAVDDAVTGGENDVVTGSVTPGGAGQDRDPDGDPLIVDSVNGVSGNVGAAVLGSNGGRFTIAADGSYSFDPGTAFDDMGPGQSRTTSVFYTVSDGEGGFDTATVTVTVAGLNDAPVAGPGPALTGTDGQPISVDVSGIFSDPDNGGPLTFEAVGLPSGLTIDPATGLITGTLPPDASQGAPGGLYSVTVTARDASGATVTSTFTFAVTNPPPVAADDLVTVAEDQPVSGSVALNDRDGSPDSDPLTFTLVGGPANGSLALNPDGTFTYTPTGNFNGTDTFTYQVSDGNGGVATAQVTITVNPVNDAPVATAPPVSTPENTPVTGAITVSDPDGDTPTFGVSSPPRSGTATVDPDGTYTYTPDPNFNGTDSFTVVVDDGHGGRTLVTISVTVTPSADVPPPVNDPPIVTASPVTTPEDTPVSGAVTATDVQGDRPTFVLGTPPTNGSLTFNPDGTYTYVPNPNYNGPDAFTVIVDDGQGGRTTVTVPVTVTPVNDAPVATAPPLSTSTETPVSGFITVTDVDGGAPTFGLASPPSNGAVTLNPDGTYTYTPNPNFDGSDVFTVVVDDGRGGLTFVAIPVTVTPVNDAPSPVGDFVPASRDAPTSGNVLVNDADIDGDPLVVTQFMVDGVVYPAGTVAQIPGTGTFVINPDGSYLFTPVPGFDGRLPRASYTVSDGTATADAPLVFVLEPSHQPEFPEPYNPPENPPPTFPPATSPEVGTPIFVEGAVIEAAQQFGGLNSTFAPLNVERPIEVMANALRNLNGATFGMGRTGSLGVVERSVEQLGQNGPDRTLGSIAGEPTAFDAKPFLGGGSHVDLRSGREGGPTDDLRIDTIRKSDILYLRLTRPSGDTARVVEYRVTMADGSPAPAWLRAIAPGLYSGLPPASTGTIDLMISVVRRDGLTIGYSVRLDTATGQITELEGEPYVTQQRSGLHDRAPTFSEQVRASSGPPGGRAALERALGLL